MLSLSLAHHGTYQPITWVAFELQTTHDVENASQGMTCGAW